MPPAAFERHLQLEGGSNFRDLGGYVAADGRTVRWRRLLRSGALARLTENDIAVLDALGIGAILDLRCTEERTLLACRWTAPTTHAHDYPSDLLFGRMTTPKAGEVIGGQSNQLYGIFPDLLAPHLRSLFALLRTEDASVVICCSAGQDRTGFVVAMLLAALGVSQAQIAEDYLRSTELRRRENELDFERIALLADSNPVAGYYARVLAERGPDALAPTKLLDASLRPKIMLAFDAVIERWGGVEAYLAEAIGVGPGDVQALRDRYLA